VIALTKGSGDRFRMFWNFTTAETEIGNLVFAERHSRLISPGVWLCPSRSGGVAVIAERHWHIAKVASAEATKKQPDALANV
jgi:hypothetical protein